MLFFLNNKARKYKIICFVFLISVQIGCKRAIEVNPPRNTLNSENVYTTDATAAAVLTDVYAQMSAQNNSLTLGEITSLSLYASLSADELTLDNINNSNLLGYYINDLTNLSNPTFWSIYFKIFSCNDAIEGLNKSVTLSPELKRQLLGEAKFVRGFCYFYLVNLYGDVPLILTTDWRQNLLAPRTSKDEVYENIIGDLKAAKELLSDKYLKGDALTPYASGFEERVRPTKWAAEAMLARVYLYLNKWGLSENECDSIIQNSSLFSLQPLNNVFKKNNKEAILQLQPVGNNNNSNTGEGKMFVLPNAGPNTTGNPVYLSNHLVNAFESGDQRAELGNWLQRVAVGTKMYYYPYKYKIGDVNTTTQEYPTILRLAEQYLIRAEARAQRNNISGAQSDLNVIRTRSQLANTSANDKVSLLKAIFHERQVELFTEWGHRWLDLKRTGQLDSVMATVTPTKFSGAIWRPYQALYPIYQNEIDKSPNMIQNAGY